MNSIIGRATAGIGATLIATALSGCALGLGKSLHQYSSLEHNDAVKGRSVESLEEKTILLSLEFDTKYADQAWSKLQSQCPKGEIHNVSARFSTDLGFLAYKQKVHMTGTCVE